jgi:hypothetical protein
MYITAAFEDGILMVEMLPIFLGALCGLTLRRLAFGDIRLLAVTCSLGILCSFVARELRQSWLYVLIDWITVYASCMVVRLIAAGVIPLRYSHRAASRTELKGSKELHCHQSGSEEHVWPL